MSAKIPGMVQGYHILAYSLQSQCQEVEACLRKNNSKKAYQLVKDLTTEKQVIYKHTRQVGEVSHRGE